MKVKSIIILLLTISFTQLFSQKLKHYKFESGFIEYKHSGSIEGTTKLYWDDFGAKEFSVTDTEIKMLGMTTKKVENKLLLGDYIYTWEKNAKTGIKMKNPSLEQMKDNPNIDMEEFQTELLKSMGYQKKGTETIFGKTCEIWQGIGKMWVWNSLPLKVDVSTMGIKSVQMVTKLSPNSSVSSKIFNIPSGVKFQTQEEAINSLSDDPAMNFEEKANVEEMKSMIKGIFGGK